MTENEARSSPALRGPPHDGLWQKQPLPLRSINDAFLSRAAMISLAPCIASGGW